jgi:hypothetical protein
VRVVALCEWLCFARPSLTASSHRSTVRNTKFTHILGQYGALGIASSVRVKELWSSYLDASGLTEAVRAPLFMSLYRAAFSLACMCCARFVSGHGRSCAAHAAHVLSRRRDAGPLRDSACGWRDRGCCSPTCAIPGRTPCCAPCRLRVHRHRRGRGLAIRGCTGCRRPRN